MPASCSRPELIRGSTRMNADFLPAPLPRRSLTERGPGANLHQHQLGRGFWNGTPRSRASATADSPLCRLKPPFLSRNTAVERRCRRGRGCDALGATGAGDASSPGPTGQPNSVPKGLRGEGAAPTFCDVASQPRALATASSRLSGGVKLRPRARLCSVLARPAL